MSDLPRAGRRAPAEPPAPRGRPAAFALVLVASLAAVGAAVVAARAGEPADASRAVPLRDFFRNPERTDYKLSPDGRLVAFLMPYASRLNVFVQPVAGGPAVRVTSETDRDIEEYFWKGNGTLVYTRDFGGDENYHVYAVRADGRRRRDLTPFPGVRSGVVDDLEEIREHEILVELNRRRREVFDAYRVDVRTGRLALVARNPGSVTAWVTDHRGRVRAAVAERGVKATLLYRERETDRFRPVLTTGFEESVTPLLFTFDDRQLYAASNLGRDRLAIVRLDLATGKEVEVLFEHPVVDAGQLAYSRRRRVVTSAAYTTSKPTRTFFDATAEEMYRKVAAMLPGYEVTFPSHDRAEALFVVRTYSDRSLGAYYLYDEPRGALARLGAVGPWLDEAVLAEMKPITYAARDGLVIHGYLTLPRGATRGGLPAVVLPHGGPWARDVWGFDPEVQFLASRGYAVLQMNFRGSTGYGRAFWRAGFKEWGRAMQDDISDGVRWLVAEGIADPARVCIYGASYGGYAALAGLAFTPDLYACGVDYVGPSNLLTFMETIPPYWRTGIESFYAMVGDPVRDRRRLVAVSPVFHADRIRAPLLVAQGAKDPRVNVAESNQIVEALRRRGVEVEYMVRANEGHGFQNEENRLHFYEAMERFLAKHLGR